MLWKKSSREWDVVERFCQIPNHRGMRFCGPRVVERKEPSRTSVVEHNCWGPKGPQSGTIVPCNRVETGDPTLHRQVSWLPAPVGCGEFRLKERNAAGRASLRVIDREMGTREVYEQKLRSGNLHHDPTMNPGLGSARCPRCLSLLDSNSEKGEWTITSVLHDATTVAGCGFGGLLSAIHGMNTGIPFLQNRLKGPKWLPFVAGLPPLLFYSGVSAAFGGYALPKFAQLSVTSYYAASSASHYGISLLTRHVEETYTSRNQKERIT